MRNDKRPCLVNDEFACHLTLSSALGPPLSNQKYIFLGRKLCTLDLMLSFDVIETHIRFVYNKHGKQYF